MPAPGLDAPADEGVEVARAAAREQSALRGIDLGIDAELAPLLHDHRPGPRHDGPGVAFHHHPDGEGFAVGREPVVAALAEAGLLQQLLGGRRVGLPPAHTESRCDLFGVGRDLVAHGRTQTVGDLLAHGRVVRFDLAFAGVDLEVLEPFLHRPVVDVGMGAGRRNTDRGDGGRAPVRCHRNRLDVDQQGQRPAHVTALEVLVLQVEDQRRQGRVRMPVREALEPAFGCLGLLGQREHAFRRDVVHHVELVVELRDHAFVRWARVHVNQVFRTGLAKAAQGRALPVVAQLPDVPFAVRVVAVEHIGAQRNRLAEIELERLGDFLENVLGHDPSAVPAYGEDRMETRVRLLELEHHGIGIGRRDAVDIEREHGAPAHRRVLDLRLDRIDHVVGRELHAVAPENALAQLHGHLREVGVVDRLVAGQRVVPDTIQTLFRIDVPEGVHRNLVQAGGLAAAADGPDIEPTSILDRAFGVLQDQGFVARQVGKAALRLSCRRDRQQADPEYRHSE